ncbi:MAG TPA: DUF4260 domain-containing protein [Xanthobacteraceae bacterium]|nr:DUF4260 domain-containing protein [Xanthobacteraceae bacterium]
MADPQTPAGVTGLPRLLLRLEGAALLGLSLYLYPRVAESWWLFAGLVLLPDLSFLGYLAGPRAGARLYNAAHTLLGPIALALAGMMLPAIVLVAIALVWAAHIGADRLLGFGLKYEAGFGFTHLGRVGRPPS